MIVREIIITNRFGQWMAARGWGGFCLVLPFSCLVLYWMVAPDSVRRHEMVHVIQAARYGFFGFYARYLWWLLKYGYENHPMEKEARRCEDC